jgi:hypothetical protein
VSPFGRLTRCQSILSNLYITGYVAIPDFFNLFRPNFAQTRKNTTLCCKKRKQIANPGIGNWYDDMPTRVASMQIEEESEEGERNRIA